MNNHTFCGATPTQIGYLSGITSSSQTQLSTCLKRGVRNNVTADTTLIPSTYEFCGATVTQIGYLSGPTSAIQT